MLSSSEVCSKIGTSIKVFCWHLCTPLPHPLKFFNLFYMKLSAGWLVGTKPQVWEKVNLNLGWCWHCLNDSALTPACLKVSNFTLLLVVFKWYGSERVKGGYYCCLLLYIIIFHSHALCILYVYSAFKQKGEWKQNRTWVCLLASHLPFFRTNRLTCRWCQQQKRTSLGWSAMKRASTFYSASL